MDVSRPANPISAALHLAALVASSDDAIVSKDLRGIVTSWNPAAERMFGYSEAEAVGRSITLIIPKERLSEETMVLSRIVAGESVRHFETIRQTKDGRLLDVSLTISPIRTPEGTIVGASKIARDITAEKRLRKEAENASRMKDEFLISLSHELRTPLNTVLGYTKMLREGQVQPENQPKVLEVIQRNADALEHLVNDLLDTSAVMMGKVRLKLEPVDAAEILGEAVESIRPTAEAKRVTLRLDLQRGLLLSADVARLRQVVFNLLSNAVRFTPAGGSVDASGRRLADGMIRLSVRDTGIGIAPESLPMIFQRFWQGDRGGSREYGGLGIGLALARQFTELHGGTIRAFSEGPGKGALFQVDLPPLVEQR